MLLLVGLASAPLGVSYTFPGPPNGAGALNWDFMVVAHELGHNFGAGHTHQTCVSGAPIDPCFTGPIDCGDDPGSCSTPPQSCIATGTIMSYCHLCPGGLSNITTSFHPYSVSVMQNALSCLPCFTGVGTTVCLGVPSSTGVGAILAGSGSSSLAANVLDLTCSELPAAGGGTTAMILNSRGPAGITAHPAPGGFASDGYLCIGIQSAGARFGRHINDIDVGTAGTFTRSIDLLAIPHSAAPPCSVAAQAGETWYFQVWYRDVAPPLGRSNFSSAVSVLITP